MAFSKYARRAGNRARRRRQSLLQVLERIGMSVCFRYQKYRREFAIGEVHVAVDETPIGNYVEFEGSEDGIRESGCAKWESMNRSFCAPAIIPYTWSIAGKRRRLRNSWFLNSSSTSDLNLKSRIKRGYLCRLPMLKMLAHMKGMKSRCADGFITNEAAENCNSFCLRDGTGVIQCVAFKGNFTPEQFDALDKLTQESSIEIRGKVRKDCSVSGRIRTGCYGIRNLPAGGKLSHYAQRTRDGISDGKPAPLAAKLSPARDHQDPA